MSERPGPPSTEEDGPVSQLEKEPSQDRDPYKGEYDFAISRWMRDSHQGEE